MDVSVIIPCVKNHIKYLDDLFGALSKQTFVGEWEVILVVEGDYNGELIKKIKQYPLNTRIYFSKARNPGVNRNIALKKAKGNIIAFIDSDCIPYENWLQNLIKPINDCDGTQGIDYSYDNTHLGKFLEKQQLNFLNNSVEKGRCKFIDTRNFAIMTEALKKVGYFDENLVSSEDKDLGYRLFKSNFNIILNKDAIVLHRWQKGSLVGFFKWGMWYGRGDYNFSQKWHNPSIISNLKSILKDVESALFWSIKALRSSDSEREVNFLFSSRQLGVACGKLRAMLFKT